MLWVNKERDMKISFFQFKHQEEIVTLPIAFSIPKNEYNCPWLNYNAYHLNIENIYTEPSSTVLWKKSLSLIARRASELMKLTLKKMISALISTLILWNKSPMACTKAARRLAFLRAGFSRGACEVSLACAPWLCLCPVWCRIRLSLQKT